MSTESGELVMVSRSDRKAIVAGLREFGVEIHGNASMEALSKAIAKLYRTPLPDSILDRSRILRSFSRGTYGKPPAKVVEPFKATWKPLTVSVGMQQAIERAHKAFSDPNKAR